MSVRELESETVALLDSSVGPPLDFWESLKSWGGEWMWEGIDGD